MRCSNCGSDNPAGKKFCSECGAGVSRGCPQCGAENAPAAKFCGDCGAELSPPVQPPVAEASPVQPREVAGERRHLTVLFCDLVGSTGIAAQLDPEEWRDTVAGYQRTAAEAITRFGGHVAKYLGDGVMAFFGYPTAHDNDAERAARAGLGILDGIAKLNESRSDQPKLSVRIGIDSGPVVVGTGAGDNIDAFGGAANIAARVQSTAETDTVVASEATHRLISGLFVVQDRGAHQLKGIEHPVKLYRVVRPSGMRGRFEAAAATGGLTPFVGREDELRSLMTRWERVLDGEGQVVTIIGEAGMGKSRLVRRFHEQIPGTPHTWLEAGAGAFFQNTPFYPVAEMLRQFVADSVDQIPQLASRLTAVGLRPAEAIPLLAPLLNLQLPPEYPASPLPPEQQRRRLLATLVQWMLGSARTQPLISVIEDLHWADPSTLELIQLLVEQGGTAPLLLLYTARPEFHPPWPLRAHHAQLALNRLSARNVRTMVGEVAARKALSDETIATVVERTGGVPLFIEELTRAVLESGDNKLIGHAIPVTLHDSLMARLDRLGPAKEVIQIGAVLGSDFSYDLLQAVCPMPEADLQRSLVSLTDAELLYVHGIAPEASYQFKHALIRDVAYEALLKSRRKELHFLVARKIDEKFQVIKEAHPEVLARHWTEAGETEQAMLEWSRAGKAAESRNAFIEGQKSLQHALALLYLLPESPERDSRELELRQSLVQMLYFTRGWAAPETVEAAARIGLLAERSGNLARLVEPLLYRSFHTCMAGNLSTAAALADQGLELALREGKPSMVAFQYEMQVIVRYYRGDLVGAESHFAAGLGFFDDPVFRQSHSYFSTFGYASWDAWILGRADVARERSAKMKAAVNPANPHDQPWADVLAAFLHALTRENETAEALAARALDLCEKHGFPNDAAFCRVYLGYARAHLGEAAGHIAMIREGIDTLVRVGIRVGITRYLTELAAAQHRAGAVGDALETVEQALNFNPEELFYRPETLRIRGELRLDQGDLHVAEADFRDSISLAKDMSAKAWELRATTSLARLLTKQGCRQEARVMLAEIYGWFTEGFDTADLKDAKALLDELSR